MEGYEMKKFIKYLLDYKKNQNLPFRPLPDDKPVIRCHSETYDIKIFGWERTIGRFQTETCKFDIVKYTKEILIKELAAEIVKHIDIIKTQKEYDICFNAIIPIGIKRKNPNG
ncbi:MAG: hypothetical protein KAT68_19590 [Bacteroidales bacterium]|nr:hypothetical protein [Bacteroidales bacterium]